MMDPKPRPNERQYLAVLRAMPPIARIHKAFELSEFTKRLALAGLGRRFPDRPETELRQFLARRMMQSPRRVSKRKVPQSSRIM